MNFITLSVLSFQAILCQGEAGPSTRIESYFLAEKIIKAISLKAKSAQTAAKMTEAIMQK